MAIPGILSNEAFSYDIGFTPTAECAIDIPGKQVVLKDPPKTTLPDGGFIQITQLVTSAYGQATNTDLADQISGYLLGAFAGIRESQIKDESIATSDEAQTRAEGELKLQSTVPINFNFSTEQFGFEPGQYEQVTYAAAGVDAILQVNEVGFSIQNGKVLYSIADSTVTKEPPGEFIRRALKPPPDRAPLTFVPNPP